MSHPLATPDEVFLAHKLANADIGRFQEIAQSLVEGKLCGDFGNIASYDPLYKAIFWVAVLCSKGCGSETMAALEQKLPAFFARIDRAYEEKDEEQKRLSEKVYHAITYGVLYDYSPAVQKRWKDIYRGCQWPEGRVHAFMSFVASREAWLGIPQTESARILLELGWQCGDAFMAYLLGCTRSYAPDVSIEVVASLVKENEAAALAFLEPKNYRDFLTLDDYHGSYPKHMQEMWVEFLFRHCDVRDDSFLRAEHKSKKLQTLCSGILAEKKNPNVTKERFEDRLKASGLLFDENASLDFSDPKLLKKQRQGLTAALVSFYQWNFAAWQKTFTGSAVEETARSLVWGVYDGETLKFAFILAADGGLTDELGARVSIGAEDKIALAHPVELGEKRVRAWKKRLKENGRRQAIPQLTLPVCNILLEEMDGNVLKPYFGAVTKHITIVGTAGKWGMIPGRDASHYSCYHLLDPIHKIGAQLQFDTIWSGPEYNSDDEIIRDAAFYRASDLAFGENVPNSAVCSPFELPKRFVSTALAVFNSIAGVNKR
ncbi:MAG: DUF4132 domain-containing protein [Candidatus Accumulibacter sp.]|nr:DUF4132 domain-containing protein [Accumulibacter sp.]